MSRKPQIYTEVRRNNIRELMLEGKSTSYIVAYCDHNYGVKRRTVERDITAIYSEVKEELSKTKESIMELHIARYENLYRFYMDKGTEEEPNFQYSPETAAKMLEKKERLLGLLNKQNETIVQLNQQNNYQQNNFILDPKFYDALRESDDDTLIKIIENFDE
ncbi:MAG: hypothetical protein ACOC2W_01435 [bacterium]